MMKNILFLVVISVFIFGSCDKDEDVVLTYEEQLAVDIKKIENYLSENELVADSTESGIFYIIEEEGTGSYPALDSIVEVNYVGMYLNEQVFDSGTVDYRLDGFILGWQEGIPLFKEGGSGKLFIPSGLGYGAYDYYSIPGNSILIFEIELINVGK